MSYLLSPAERYEEIDDRDKFEKELVSLDYLSAEEAFELLLCLTAGGSSESFS